MTSPEETVPCGLCGRPTPMTGTRRCDWCWELEKRVKMDLELARKVLDSIAPQADLLRALSALEIAFSGRPSSEDEDFWEAWADVPGITTTEVQRQCLEQTRAIIAKARGGD